MKLSFTQQQIDTGYNKIEFEEDGVIFYAQSIEGENQCYLLTGKAVIEGETYHDFQVKIQLEQSPEQLSAESIIESDWEWYDFPF